MNLIEPILNGEIRALSRLISRIENNDQEGLELLKKLYKYTGNAVVIGLTGAPGAGKSTITNQLISVYLNKGFKVAVLAVDPSSVFTGGSVLGDRIRMPQINPNLFIRSLASRGCLGGLSRAVGSIVRLLDAAGYQRIILETVGTGQSEIEIRNYAHTVVVVSTPNMGDDIQTLKAGILEIGDIYVVNKADLPESDRTMSDLIKMISLAVRKKKWVPPVLKVIASDGRGIPELTDQIEAHYHYLNSEGELSSKRLAIAEKELSEGLKELLLTLAVKKLKENGQWQEYCELVSTGELDPWTGAEKLFRNFK